MTLSRILLLLLLVVVVCVALSSADLLTRATYDNVSPKYENVPSNDIVSDKALTDKPEDEYLLSDQGDEDEERDEEGDEDDDGIFMVTRKAKSFLRVRRGWTIRHLWGEGQEEERESRENRAEASRRAQHASYCRSTCWANWRGWGACSTPCGSSGVKTRTRSRSPPRQCVGWVNSHGCPGPSRQNEACNRSCRNGGSLRSTDCSCPAAYTGRCCENRVTCPFPGSPSHGSVQTSSSAYHYGVRATFSCNTGYRLVGSRSRSCQSNGQWSASVPTCTLRICRDPGTPAHSIRTGSNFAYNARVIYACVSGYTMVGDATVVCQASGQWAPSNPSCQPVDCGSLEAPAHGSLSSSATVYQSTATYSCDLGHHMVGSARRVCQVNGQWDGAQPSCNPITCSPLSAPSNGDIQSAPGSLVTFGSSITFSCHDGYTLQGHTSRQCGGSGPAGVWTGSQPSCIPVDCGNPGAPEYGFKEGGVYSYTNRVTYQCIPGYVLSGPDEIECQADGSWTGTVPTCQPCSTNTYKQGLNNIRECQSCPPNSHTISEASEGIERCMCDYGYEGQAGVCSEILCEALSSPANARIELCDNHVDSSCQMTCVEGHIRSSGNENRQCHVDGSWTGEALVCQACPVNTYRTESGHCESCPDNSHTDGPGQERTGCECNDGFYGPLGGPCADVDECTGNVTCSQECVNTYGSFHCDCNLPGYILDEEDESTCLSNNQCSPLEAPDNGGLVCMLRQSTNTQRCDVRCNPGFDHLIHVNEFEECGPSTNWLWSNEINDVPILPCVEQFFPGVTTAVEVAYFMEDCDVISDAQKEEIAHQFVQGLTDNGICMESGEAVCSLDDVSIECGATVDYDDYYDDEDYEYDDDHHDGGAQRSRRSAEDSVVNNELKVKFKMEVPEVAQHTVNCSEFCPHMPAHVPICQQRCQNRYNNRTNAIINTASGKLSRIFGANLQMQAVGTPPPTEPPTMAATGQPRPSGGPHVQFATPNRRGGGGALLHFPGSNVEGMPDRVVPQAAVTPSSGTSSRYLTWFARDAPVINIAGLTLRPLAGIRKKAVVKKCSTGMIFHDNICAPCPPGSYLPTDENECSRCPRGTYQPDHQQIECLACAQATGRGATSCPRSLPNPPLLGGSILQQARDLVNVIQNRTVSIRVRLNP